MNSIGVVALISLLLVQLATCDVVQTENGSVEGTTLETRLNSRFHAFLRIPFARPPIGDLRFRDPLPAENWEGVRNGTYYGQACFQHETVISFAAMSEDCLHLNVFTRQLPSSINDLKPVIVFIHGGGFEFGSGVTASPIVLMDRDIVFVNLNYRLGPFGFMAAGIAEVPGNAGLKDQSMALGWVKRNIANFGGDPEAITLFGMSAGAYSATSQIISPMSRDLFQGVIAMSGAITWQKDFDTEAVDAVRRVSSGIDCSRDSTQEIITCLRTKTPEEILSVAMSDTPACSPVPWKPVVEPDFGQDRFLTDQPNKLFANGNFSHDIKVLIGITADEFISPVPGKFCCFQV